MIIFSHQKKVAFMKPYVKKPLVWKNTFFPACLSTHSVLSSYKQSISVQLQTVLFCLRKVAIHCSPINILDISVLQSRVDSKFQGRGEESLLSPGWADFYTRTHTYRGWMKHKKASISNATFWTSPEMQQEGKWRIHSQKEALRTTISYFVSVQTKVHFAVQADCIEGTG